MSGIDRRTDSTPSFFPSSIALERILFNSALNFFGSLIKSSGSSSPRKSTSLGTSVVGAAVFGAEVFGSSVLGLGL